MNATVDARIQRLEVSQRRLAIGLAAAVGALLLGAVQRQPPELHAPAFHLTNADGQVVATLGTGPQGPGLFIKDSRGQNRITLTHEPEQTGLSILDTTGTTRIGVVQFAHGGGGVALHGEKAKGAAVLYLKHGQGRLSFYDTEGGTEHQQPLRDQ